MTMCFRYSVFLRVLIFSILWISFSTSARANRFAVLIGNNIGAKDEARLRFAHDDAQKFQSVLQELGGFTPENTVMLLDQDVETVRRALIAVNDRIRAVTRDGSSMLLVYYSGHADSNGLHLGDTTFELKQLEQLVRGSAASFRLMILDACRSGSLTRVKGGWARPPLNISLDPSFKNNPSVEEGAVFLTSSAANEDAQESDQLKGSFFTHYLVSGLLGEADTNSDGKVVLEEAYRYAYENTLRASSRTLAGLQHPTFRYELRGYGQVVLTTLREDHGRAILHFPSGHGFLVMRDHAEGAVVAEVGFLSTVRRLSVKPGWYFVRGRGRDALLETRVELHAGAHVILDEKQFERIAYARLVRKGAREVSMVHGVQAGYRLQSPLSNARTICHGGFIGYAFEFEYMNLISRLGWCRGSFTNQALIGLTLDEIDATVRLTHAWDTRWITFDVGLSVGVALFHQSFTTQRIAPSRTTLAGELGVVVGITVPFSRGWYGSLDLEAQTYFFKQQFIDERDPGFIKEKLTPAFALRPAFAIGKHW